MNRFFFSTTCILSAAVPATSGLAQDAVIIGNANRLSLGARVGMNFTANFRNQSQSNPGAGIGILNRNYDDGYVRVDSGGIGSGGTWNWGYQNASQVSGDTLVFHSDQLATVPLEAEQDSDDIRPGIEVIYQRVFGKFFLGGHWGFEGSIGYTDLDIEDNSSANGVLTHITDTYDLNGVVPPTAPYNGTFDGPGPILSTIPTRTTPTEAAFTTSHQQLSGYVIGVRLGPFFEWNLGKRFAVAFSGGLVLAPTKIDYEFSETTSVSGGPPTTIRGESDATDLLYGHYVAGTLHCNLTRSWGLFASAQFQTLNELEQKVAGRTATLEQDSTFYGVAGVSYRF